ncbi:MAG: penicillin-binding protein 2 [Actinomycetales bacterium]|nr:penicillin-binding protein 2 [Actinomycetales bacterium]
MSDFFRTRYFTPGNSRKRIRWFQAGVVLVAAIFALRLLDFQVFSADRINAESYAKRSNSRVLPAMRGTIYDNSGQILAKSVLKYNIVAVPANVRDYQKVNADGSKVTVTPDQATALLAAILQMDPLEVKNKITGTSQYSLVAKRVDASVYTEVKKLDIPWIAYESLASRVYPNGAVAGAMLGWINQDGQASAGIEREMDECLAGVDGEETYERGGTDAIRIPSSAIVSKQAKDGRDVVLTINRDLQYYAQQVVTAQTNYLRADWGTAIVIEAKTGKILAAAEAPTMDPNVYGSATEADRHARVFETAFEPGSVIKTVTAATLIDQGLATPATKTIAPFGMDLPNSGGYRVTDSHQHGNDKLTLTGVLRDSSNTGIMKLGVKAPVATRFSYLQKFGLGAKTGVGFPGESAGVLPPLDTWDGIKKYVSMFGQGIAQTPLQTAMMYQAIANNGVRLQPQLVAGCKDDSGKLVPVATKPGVAVVSPQTARTTVDMLEKVVEQGGIGKTAGVPGYRVGGKSGTAQIVNPDTGQYGNLHAISFIGMAPAENPQYVVAVTFFKSRTKSNSIGATPAFKSIMEQVLRTYRVPPSTTKSANIPTEW